MIMLNKCQNCSKCCVKTTEIYDNVKRLSDLNINDSGIIVNIAGSDELKIKIMEMGLILGTNIRIINKSPFGDPIAIFLRNYNLSIGKNEADVILVKKK